MEEARENGKELSHSAHSQWNEMKYFITITWQLHQISSQILNFCDKMLKTSV
jgi:hypothetical protein